MTTDRFEQDLPFGSRKLGQHAVGIAVGQLRNIARALPAACHLRHRNAAARLPAHLLRLGRLSPGARGPLPVLHSAEVNERQIEEGSAEVDALLPLE